MAVGTAEQQHNGVTTPMVAPSRLGRSRPRPPRCRATASLLTTAVMMPATLLPQAHLPRCGIVGAGHGRPLPGAQRNCCANLIDLALPATDPERQSALRL